MAHLIKHVISIKDFDRSRLERFLITAQEFQQPHRKLPAAPHQCGYTRENKPKILAALFFEPSTRTRLSFESAMIQLGGHCIGFADPQNSSVQKGESIRDTIKTVANYADCIVIRHSVDGAARHAADLSSVPVINAGDGSVGHVSQHLLDVFTIQSRLGRLEGLKIGYMGDLKYGRTARGLAYALSLFPNNQHYFIAPDPGLQIDGVDFLDPNAHSKLTELDSDLVLDLDVLYVTRLQKERYPDPQEFNRIIKKYRITKETILHAKKDFVLMHPLPRNSEIAEEVDELPCAAYFEQVQHGITVRKCLLHSLIVNKGI